MQGRCGPHKVTKPCWQQILGVMVWDSRRGDVARSKHESTKSGAPKHALYGCDYSDRLDITASSSIATLSTTHCGIGLGVSIGSVTR